MIVSQLFHLFAYFVKFSLDMFDDYVRLFAGLGHLNSILKGLLMTTMMYLGNSKNLVFGELVRVYRNHPKHNDRVLVFVLGDYSRAYNVPRWCLVTI